MENACPPCLKYIFQSDFGPVFDGKALHRIDLSNYGFFPWEIDSENFWWSRPLKFGEIGCALSHYSCWQEAHRLGSSYCLVLEDDVVFDDEFCERFRARFEEIEKKVKRWDLLYLGRLQLEPNRSCVGNLVKPGYSHCTYGYILSSSGLHKVLRQDFLKSIIPLDEFMPALYIDHPRADVRNRFPRCLDAYALEPPLVGQLAKDAWGSDTEASDFVILR